MYSQLLDQETFARVVSAAPIHIPGEYDAIAKEIINKLDLLIVNSNDKKPFYRISIAELTEALPIHDLTPALVGRVVGELGLQKHRRRDGYWVYFTGEQILILASATIGHGGSNAS